MRQRTSKSQVRLSGTERNIARKAIIKQLFHNELTNGQALKKMRVEVLGISQQHYCQMVQVSRQTLSDLENDKGNYSVEIINQVFRPLGLEVGIVPIVRDVLTEALLQER